MDCWEFQQQSLVFSFYLVALLSPKLLTCLGFYLGIQFPLGAGLYINVCVCVFIQGLITCPCVEMSKMLSTATLIQSHSFIYLSKMPSTFILLGQCLLMMTKQLDAIVIIFSLFIGKYTSTTCCFLLTLLRGPSQDVGNFVYEGSEMKEICCGIDDFSDAFLLQMPAKCGL